MDIQTKIESVLFVASKPLTVAFIAKIVDAQKNEVQSSIQKLKTKYSGNSGVELVENGSEVQMVSNPKCSQFTQNFIKEEISGPLTRPQLETLTVIAYTGPVSKLTIEQVRGVNCSLILRNLLMRGLIEEEEQEKQPVYSVTIDFLRHMGISSQSELQDFEKLNNHESIKAMRVYG